MQILHKVTDANQDLFAYTFGKYNTSKEQTERSNIQKISVGKIFEGTVLKPKNNPQYYLVELKGGKTVSIWNGDHKFAEGDSIKVIYKGKKTGKDGKQYDQWERQ